MGKFAPGDSVAFSSSFMNDLVGLVEHRGRASADTLSGNDRPTIIKVKNISGDDQEYNSVMALGDLLYEDVEGNVAEDMLGRFRRGQVALKVDTVDLNPASVSISRAFCILKDSLKNNEIGDAYIIGTAATRILVVSGAEEHYKFAMPVDEESYLVASPCGIFEIIWKEDGHGLTPKWGFVRMGRESYAPPLYEATADEDEEEGEIKAKRVASTADLVGDDETFIVVPDEPEEPEEEEP